MFEFVHSFNADAMYVLNHWLPTSTDVFWLAVTKTITWIPLYVVMVERLFRRSAMDVFVKRLALVVLGVLLWDQGAELFKHWIARPRPCQTMEDLRVLVHCSPYGFFSAHAANAFGLAFLVLCGDFSLASFYTKSKRHGVEYYGLFSGIHRWRCWLSAEVRHVKSNYRESLGTGSLGDLSDQRIG